MVKTPKPLCRSETAIRSRRREPFRFGFVSLVCAAAAIALALSRTVRNASALAKAEGPIESQTRLARLIFRDHLFCLVAMAAVLTLQLAAR